MTNLLLDPWVLTWVDTTDIDSADDYVERITSIFEFSRSTSCQLRVRANAAELLEQAGVFPLSTDVPSVLWPRREDVYRIVSSILEKSPRSEDLGVEDLLASSVNFLPSIDIHCSYRQQNFSELLTLSLIEREAIGVNDDIFSDLVSASQKFQVESDVLTVQTANGIGPCREGVYEGVVGVHCSFKSFFLSINPLDLALSGYLEKAVALGIWQIHQNGNSPFKPDGWSFGPNFLNSVRDCGFQNNHGRFDALLRTCINVVSRTSERDTHVLRVSSGGNSKQRVRAKDGAGAWRVDVDREFHIHYWSSSFGFEFADAVFHNDFSITE